MISKPLAILLLALAFGTSACTTCDRSAGRPFVMKRDNFAFANELKWTYTFHDDGSFTARDVEPEPDRPHRCFPIVRAAREFFYHASFDPSLPKVADKDYQRLVRQVFARNSRCPAEPSQRIVIPGYPDLFAFSSDRANLIQDEIGGSWRSFYQRGNWRMIFPITDRRERKTARELFDEVQSGRLPIIHVYRFPDVRLNHGILVHGAEKHENHYVFSCYDPNNPGRLHRGTKSGGPPADNQDVPLLRTLAEPVDRFLSPHSSQFFAFDTALFQPFFNFWTLAASMDGLNSRSICH